MKVNITKLTINAAALLLCASTAHASISAGANVSNEQMTPYESRQIRSNHHVTISNTTGSDAQYNFTFELCPSGYTCKKIIRSHLLAPGESISENMGLDYIINYSTPGTYMVTASTIITGPENGASSNTAYISVRH